jgi:hypothetical protein
LISPWLTLLQVLRQEAAEIESLESSLNTFLASDACTEQGFDFVKVGLDDRADDCVVSFHPCLLWLTGIRSWSMLCSLGIFMMISYSSEHVSPPIISSAGDGDLSVV